MARRVMANINKGKLGFVSGALSRPSKSNPAKARALRKVAQILVARPKMASQVSATTLSQIDTRSDLTGQLAVTVHKAMPEALSREAQKTQKSHSYRTPKKQKQQ